MKSAKLIYGLLAAIGLALASCSTQAEIDAPPTPIAAEASVHPVSGLDIVPLSITSDSATHEFRVEMARTGQEQARGLMFRTEMAPDDGMLFPHEQPRMASFWMRNTVLSLDIIFIGADRRIINIAENATPYSETPIPSAGPALAVLELNAGRSAELGIGPGDLVEW